MDAKCERVLSFSTFFEFPTSNTLTLPVSFFRHGINREPFPSRSLFVPKNDDLVQYIAIDRKLSVLDEIFDSHKIVLFPYVEIPIAQDVETGFSLFKLLVLNIYRHQFFQQGGN